MINLVSYFEIGGHIHECEVGRPQSVRASHVQDVMETKMELSRDPGKMNQKTISSMSYTERAIGVLKQGQTSRRQKFGATLMRWSVGGLLVPDPLPLVDEVLFGTTFVIGAVLYATD